MNPLQEKARDGAVAMVMYAALVANILYLVWLFAVTLQMTKGFLSF